MKINPYFVIFSLFTILQSCEYASENDLTEQIDPADNITYAIHVAPIINANCVSCHSNPAVAGASIPMTNYSEVKSAFENTNALNRMNKQPGEGGFMPKYGTRLPQTSIDLVEEWINEGFLE